MLSIVFIRSAELGEAGKVSPDLASQTFGLIQKLEGQPILTLPGDIRAGQDHAARVTAGSLADQFSLLGLEVGEVTPDITLRPGMGTAFSQFSLPKIQHDTQTVIAVTAQDVIRSNVEHLLSCNAGIALALVDRMEPGSALFVTSGRHAWSKMGYHAFDGFQAVDAPLVSREVG